VVGVVVLVEASHSPCVRLAALQCFKQFARRRGRWGRWWWWWWWWGGRMRRDAREAFYWIACICLESTALRPTPYVSHPRVQHSLQTKSNVHLAEGGDSLGAVGFDGMAAPARRPALSMIACAGAGQVAELLMLTMVTLMHFPFASRTSMLAPPSRFGASLSLYHIRSTVVWVPSVFERDLQCELLRKVDTERNVIGHTHVRFKRTCMGSNGILERGFLSENAHRTAAVREGNVPVPWCNTITRRNRLIKRVEPERNIIVLDHAHAGFATHGVESCS
jgi:hypothetical protein